MARKPVPLTLVDAHPSDTQADLKINDENQPPNQSAPKSSTSTKFPKSPTSPVNRLSVNPPQSSALQSDTSSLTPAADTPPPQQQQQPTQMPPSATVTAQISTPSTPAEPTAPERPARSGFFSNHKSKPSARVPTSEAIMEQASPNAATARPTKPKTVSAQEDKTVRTPTLAPVIDKSVTRKPVGTATQSDSSLSTIETKGSENTAPTGYSGRKNKPKPFSILSRTRSVRGEDSPMDAPSRDPEKTHTYGNSIKTAPLRSDTDRSVREAMASKVRQRSADRIPPHNGQAKEQREPSRAPSSFAASFRDGHGGSFLSNIKTSATKGAGALSKGIFGKTMRSASTNEREPPVDDEHYVLKVINLPLVEQTRLTRISKTLAQANDRTEFWLPSFPWRAIDYLNYKGSEVEGLYRVPGSGPQIKKWQRRFDEEHDINFFEQNDLYDINIIGSMLKAWLRELPDELLPKAVQDRINREAAGQGNETVPQILIDELANLPPFNYYLLFAITCHLSLLLAHSDKNKMDYRNLCICFQPCMKIDAFCFKFLVCNWRACWQGCLTEERYTEIELALIEGERPPNSRDGRSSTAAESHDEREGAVSSDSSKPSSVNVSVDSNGQIHLSSAGKASTPPASKSTGAQASTSKAPSATVAQSNLTAVPEASSPERPTTNGIRPLSPIQPLSPMHSNFQ